MTNLWRVISPHFSSVVELSDSGIIIKTDPILKWALGKRFYWFRIYCERKGWEFERV